MDGRSADHKPGARGFAKIREIPRSKIRARRSPGPAGFAKAGGETLRLSHRCRTSRALDLWQVAV